MTQIRILKHLLLQIAAEEDKKKAREYTAETFYASEIGYCPRSLYFKRKGVEEHRFTPKNILRMEDGTNVHLKLQEYLFKLGILLEREKVVKDKTFGIRGHFDGVIRLTMPDGTVYMCLLEIKTINKDGFAKLTGPSLAYLKQATFYAVKKKLTKILFLYYCVDNADIKEYLVDVDHELYTGILANVQYVRECLKSDTVPDETHPDECYFCGYSYLCNPKKEANESCLVL